MTIDILALPLQAPVVDAKAPVATRQPYAATKVPDFTTEAHEHRLSLTASIYDVRLYITLRGR